MATGIATTVASCAIAKTVVPKLLNLTTSNVRDQRTLIWLQNQSNTVNWSKWDAVVCGIDSYKLWSKRNAKIVGIVITDLEHINHFKDLFEISKNVSLMLLSQKILITKSQEFWSENFDNILNLDNVLDQYPFIETPWDNTLDDAVTILGILCRYNRIVDCNSSLRTTSNITFAKNIQPPQVWVFTQFFKHKDSSRYQEIKECLKRNSANPYIDKVVLINETDYAPEYKKILGSTRVEQIVNRVTKIQQVISGRRLTYADFLNYVREQVPNGVFVILCNADIYFGDSLLDLWKINMADKMFGLLRWDVDDKCNEKTAKLFGPRADSQDSWIFLSDSIKSRTWDYQKFNFQLGQPGCDNAFAGHILRQKFLLSNPALTFKSFHLHNTNIRNYDKKDAIRADIYINLAPTYIIDSKQVVAPKGGKPPLIISNELAAFEIKSSSMSNEITYCTMLEKAGRYKWEPSVENYYFDAAIPLYKWNKLCVTPNGLVYDLYNIYTGKEEERFNYWASAVVTPLTPLQKRDKMFAIPFKNTDVFKHPDVYILNYISRCVRLLKSHPETSFWIPYNFVEYLEYFEWSNQKLNPVFFDENTACYAEEVIGFLPGPLELGIEDIQALRELYPSWVEKPCGKVCSVVIGSSITQGFAEEKITQFLHANVAECDEDWTIRFVSESDYASYDSLIGASLCIFVGLETNTWTKLWSLPKGCCVIEFQQELNISGEFQHLAHVSSFKSWVLLLSKGSVKDVQEQIMEQLQKWFIRNGNELDR